MILIKIQGDWVTHGILSKVILIAKTMRKKNFKIQMLAGNSLKIRLGAFFEISTTLVDNSPRSMTPFYFFLNLTLYISNEIQSLSSRS